MRSLLLLLVLAGCSKAPAQANDPLATYAQYKALRGSCLGISPSPDAPKIFGCEKAHRIDPGSPR